ncbi:MAG: opacity protein-like surface antigen [Candidatus Azotimanducaceae bacterium]|jgi:opacity protein-like surface antigen
MKKFLLILTITFTTLSFSQTKLYVHPDADTYVANTKTIAILPMKVQVKLRPKQLKDFTSEQIIEMGKNESLDIQKAMYTWFLTRKKRGTMLVGVQNPTRTNALLKKEGIDIHSYDEYLPSELGKILGVETVITGSYETSKPMSTGAAIGLAVLTGGMFATNSAVMNMDFTSTTDDELVVNYNKKVKGSLGSDAQDLINVLMRKVSRRIPYTK